MAQPDLHAHEGKLSRRREIITSYKARSDARRTVWERTADMLTSRFGTVAFLTLNAIWFIVWVLWNTGMAGMTPFDPYPFGFLTMVVSLEAIFLAIIVLISQNRAAHIADMREEIELQVSMIAEEEITKIMNMLCMLLDKHGIDISHDPELTRMLKPIKNSEIERRIEDELHQ
ncbi:MAG TPA: DUF1003 domain-containing protein [Verrucomicrobiae bacterium]|nr:DUF1003 domain-containing protein [Verrucomicrobiae bacterium]